MAVQIERLLDTQIREDAGELQLTPGKQVTLRTGKGFRVLRTKVLQPSDTISLMELITPGRAKDELHDHGECEFEFDYGNMARFRASVFRRGSHLTLVFESMGQGGEGEAQPVGVTNPSGTGEVEEAADGRL